MCGDPLANQNQRRAASPRRTGGGGRRPSLLAAALCAIVGLLAAGAPPAHACECVWKGSFLEVAPLATAIVRGRVLRHYLVPSPEPSTMDFEVLEVLRGSLAPGVLRVWGDNGALCRPAVTEFPVGTEWVLALDGPGSKPGAGQSPSISSCGRYWLGVDGDDAVGILRGSRPDSPSERITLAELRRSLSGRREEPARETLAFAAEVRAGERLERPFGGRFTFVLVPIPTGWEIEVREHGRDENLARLTPPLHGPNPRFVEGWHFRNADNSGPNEAGEKNVNAPQEEREFIFSPEVGTTIDGPDASRAVSWEDVETVRAFGSGTLTIVESRLGGLEPGETARFEWLRFTVELRWRARGAAGWVDKLDARANP